jgi:hypothetical protein
MGGFTTYSTFSVEVATLSDDGRYVTGFGYAILSLLLGVGAAALGVWVSANLAPVPKSRPAEDATAFSAEPLPLTDPVIAAEPPADPAARPVPSADSAAPPAPLVAPAAPSAPLVDSAKPNGDPE